MSKLLDLLKGTSSYVLTADCLSNGSDNPDLVKGGGPFIGSRGGKWADPQHKIPWNDKKHAGKPAPKARDHDKHGATELQLHIENTYHHHGQHESIRDNLAKKIAAGKYDHAQASKLFQYLADAGSKRYAKEHGSGSGHAMDVPTRQAAARQMAHDFHDEVKYGEHDHRVSSGVHAKRAKAGGGLAAMAHEHGKGRRRKETRMGGGVTKVGAPGTAPSRREKKVGQGVTMVTRKSETPSMNLPYDDHIMSFYKD